MEALSHSPPLHLLGVFAGRSSIVFGLGRDFYLLTPSPREFEKIKDDRPDFIRTIEEHNEIFHGGLH